MVARSGAIFNSLLMIDIAIYTSNSNHNYNTNSKTQFRSKFISSDAILVPLGPIGSFLEIEASPVSFVQKCISSINQQLFRWCWE